MKSGSSRAALFISGSGTNAERILESYSDSGQTGWTPAVIVCDRPSKSRAREIAREWDVPFIAHDIHAFYRENGLESISLATEEGRRTRSRWTDALREKLLPFGPDFGILAGFIPLTNITADFPCLNVHPGDLTVEADGKRLLVGLHERPIETAIVSGHATMRSSVIIAQAYTGSGGEMDTGPILGVSEAVDIDFRGALVQELMSVYKARPSRRPRGGYGDMLQELARHNQEILKRNGDWTVFPPVVRDFASGRFAEDDAGKLLYRASGEWVCVRTVEYCSDGSVNPIRV